MHIIKKIFSICLASLCLFSNAIPAYAGVVSSGHSQNSANVAYNGGSILNGAEIMMLACATNSQNLSYVLTTASGKVIVVDGGLPEDATHLREVILSKGGVVDVWLLTHPHSDHVGAITQLINDGLDGITIKSLYTSLTDIEWYYTNEAYRTQMVVDFAAAIATLPEGVVHYNESAGTVISVDGANIHILNNIFLVEGNSINNTSIVYRVDMGGKRILFLGDLGETGGNMLLEQVATTDLKSDIVQMAHHGQHGVGKNVYEVVSPTIALWNTPQWLWDNDGGDGYNTGSYLTIIVRGWMEELGVKINYATKDGDQTIR